VTHPCAESRPAAQPLKGGADGTLTPLRVEVLELDGLGRQDVVAQRTWPPPYDPVDWVGEECGGRYRVWLSFVDEDPETIRSLPSIPIVPGG
jgi:hypothetical protein